jgi:hypothetical protein
MRLLAVELRRLLSRRMVRVLGLLLAAGIALAGLSVFAQSGPGFGFRPGDLPEVLGASTVVAALLAWSIGASAIGAEWATGSMATTLLWEPRRIRLFSAKAGAVFLFAVAGTVAAQAVLAAVLLPSALRSAGATGEQWLGDTAGVIARGAVLAGLLSLLGLSVASVARNSAASVGAAFGYLLVLEGLLAGLATWLVPWLITANAVPFVGGRPFLDTGRSPIEGGLVIAAYAALALLAAGFRFRTSDVT